MLGGEGLFFYDFEEVEDLFDLFELFWYVGRVLLLEDGDEWDYGCLVEELDCVLVVYLVVGLFMVDVFDGGCGEFMVGFNGLEVCVVGLGVGVEVGGGK